MPKFPILARSVVSTSKPTIYQLERVVPSGFLALIYSFLSKIAIMAHKKWCHLTESHKRTKFGFFM